MKNPVEHRPFGRQCIIEMYGAMAEKLVDEKFVLDVLRQAAKEAGATVVVESVKKFGGWGLTACVLLTESHITFHSWAEWHYAAIDIFTCGQHTEPLKAYRYITDMFKPEYTLMNEFKRGVK